MVTANYNYVIVDHNFTVPVRVDFANSSKGAEHHRWTFEGGTPALSTKKDPGIITFCNAGAHRVTLEVWNDDDRQIKTTTLQLDSAVSTGFDARVRINNFAPAQVQIANKTIGATSYQWTFEGGIPASSTAKDPGMIHFDEPGEHTITLVANNGRTDFTFSKKIILGAKLNADFDIEPFFEDQEKHAPVKARLKNKSAGGLTWKWSTTGGTISNVTAESPEISFLDPGTYTISLTADNSKLHRVITKDIVIHSHTNLLHFQDIKLGINTAHAHVGSFFSTKLRRGFKSIDDINDVGKDIDVVFYGLNGGFSRNRFASPNLLGHLPNLGVISNAISVAVVNSQEDYYGKTVLNSTDFDDMETDKLLRQISIGHPEDSKNHFTNNGAPRVVLYQTADGRKGAIKIKKFKSDGQKNSYILVDIKTQKEPQ